MAARLLSYRYKDSVGLGPTYASDIIFFLRFKFTEYIVILLKYKDKKVTKSYSSAGANISSFSYIMKERYFLSSPAHQPDYYL